MTRQGWIYFALIGALGLLFNIFYYSDEIATFVGPFTEQRAREWISALSGWAAVLAAILTIRTMREQNRQGRHHETVLVDRVLATAINYAEEANKRRDFVQAIFDDPLGDKVGTLGADELDYWSIRINDGLFDRFDTQIGSSDFVDRIGAQFLIANLLREVKRTGKTPHIAMDVGLFGRLARYFDACIRDCEAFKQKVERRHWLIG